MTSSGNRYPAYEIGLFAAMDVVPHFSQADQRSPAPANKLTVPQMEQLHAHTFGLQIWISHIKG